MKKKNSGILAKIIVLLSFILAVFLGGYFFLDKLIVPKYFSKYGINRLGDLVNVVASLYSTPNEAKMFSLLLWYFKMSFFCGAMVVI